MNDSALTALWTRRNATLASLSGDPRPLREMSWQDRDRVDMLSVRFRRIDREITAELKRRGAPVVLDGVTLHLTRDGLHFASLIPGTTRPLRSYERDAVSTPGMLRANRQAVVL